MHQTPYFFSSATNTQNDVLEQAIELLENLPSLIDIHKTWSISHSQDHRILKQLSPFWLLLITEIIQWNSRLTLVSTGLNFFIKAVKSSTTPSQGIVLCQALAANIVPKEWQVSKTIQCTVVPQLDCFVSQFLYGFKSGMDLSQWFQYFSHCVDFISKWAHMNSTLSPHKKFSPQLPKHLWLPGFCSPKGIARVKLYNSSFTIILYRTLCNTNTRPFTKAWFSLRGYLHEMPTQQPSYTRGIHLTSRLFTTDLSGCFITCQQCSTI